MGESSSKAVTVLGKKLKKSPARLKITFSSDAYFHFATIERLESENKTKIFYAFII